MSVWRRRLFVVQNFSMFRAYLLHRKNNGDKVHEESVGVRGSATACMCCSRPGEFRECQCNACCINKVRHERPPCLTSLALVSCQSLAGTVGGNGGARIPLIDMHGIGEVAWPACGLWPTCFNPQEVSLRLRWRFSQNIQDFPHIKVSDNDAKFGWEKKRRV